MSQMSSNLERAVTEVAQGNLVLISDFEGREDEADLMFAAEFADIERFHSVYELCHGGGLVCVPMQKERLEFLQLSPLYIFPRRDSCKFYSPVDHRSGHSGIGAEDRANVVKALVNDEVPLSHENSNLATPGHTFPLCVAEGGLNERHGHTEASLALVEMAGLEHRVAVISEVMDPGTGKPMEGEVLAAYARANELVRVTIPEMLEYKGIPVF